MPSVSRRANRPTWHQGIVNDDAALVAVRAIIIIIGGFHHQRRGIDYTEEQEAEASEVS